MCDNWERPYNVGTKTRLEKSFANAPRNPLNFLRRPSFQSSRRRVMAGQYPNMGFRHPAPAIYRPDCPIPHGTLPGLRHPKPIGISVPFIQRPYLCHIPRNTFDNKNNQYISQDAKNIKDKPNEQNNELSESTAIDDLWVESLAPGGRIYYYNTRTRETNWIKPVNCRIIELNEIKQLTACSEVEKSEKVLTEDPTHNVQQPIQLHVQQPINNFCGNVFYSQNLSMTPRLMMFTPNVLTPPNLLRPPAENFHNNMVNYNIGFVMPSQILPIPVITHSVLQNAVTNECNTDVTQNLLPTSDIVQHNYSATQQFLPINETIPITNNEQNRLSNIEIDHNKNGDLNYLLNEKLDHHNITDTTNLLSKNKVIDFSNSDTDKTKADTSINDSKVTEFVKSTNEKTIMSTIKSQISLSVSNSHEMSIVKDANENRVQQTNGKAADVKSNNNFLSTTSENSLMDETKYISSVNLHSKEKKFDISRPISSTPVPGTYWSVVWTGDRRVFFYDSQNKISVWKRPTELLSRSDVDKMVKKPPVLLVKKPLAKEARKNSSDYSDIIKKQRKDDEKGENIEEKETEEETSLKTVVVEESTPVNNEKPKCDTCEQKIESICEMLSDNHCISKFRKRDQEIEKLEGCHKSRFLELLSEKECLYKEWRHVRNILKEDERYKAIQSDSLKEDLFNEYFQKECFRMLKNQDSKNSEEKMKWYFHVHYEKLKKKEEKHSHSLTVSNFKALLDDLIQSSDINWQSARQILEADSRWNASRKLRSEKCEELFNEYINAKKKVQFHRLLDELPNITIKTSWLDIRNVALKDPRCTGFSSCERKCEKEFKKYLKCKQTQERNEFEQLLRETKLITHKSKSLIDCSNHYRDIENTLAKDKRYLNLNYIKKERRRLILSYIDKLHASSSD